MQQQACPLSAADMFLSAKCAELLTAKAISLGVTLGSVVVKVPQIYKIVSSRSVDGLSPVAFYLDTLTSISNMVYHFLLGYKLENYAESVFTTVQNLILVTLLWAYEGKGSTPRTSLVSKLFVSLTGAFVVALFMSIPKSVNDVEFLREWLSTDIKVMLSRVDLRNILPFLTVLMLVVSRGTQILQNFFTKSTGSLSLITNSLLFLGASARIFTTLSGIGSDGALITTNGIAALLSGIVVVQILTLGQGAQKVWNPDKKIQ